MKVFIAEDEVPARERLIETLAEAVPEALVVGHAASVLETRRWLAANAEPDVLLLDIQLADGLSLELFRDAPLHLPTIFTTAYDEFALQAFEALAVDYLLKPVSVHRLRQAFARWHLLRERFTAQAAQALLQKLQPPLAAAPAPRQRWLGRKGAAFVALAADQVAYFVSLDKLCFAVARDGTRVLLEQTLAEVEAELDPTRYFRLNRQVIAAAPAVQRFSSLGKGRLAVQLAPALDGEVQVPQERAAAFKAWLAR